MGHRASNFGPRRIGLDSSLAPGNERRFNLAALTVNGKKGYFKKFFGEKSGLDKVIVSNAANEVVNLSVGNDETRIGPRSGSEINKAEGGRDGQGSIRVITVENPSTSGTTLDAQNFSIMVANDSREGGSDEMVFTPQKAVRDIVPGF